MNAALRLVNWFEPSDVLPDPRRRFLIVMLLLAPLPVIFDAVNTVITSAGAERFLTIPAELIIPILGLFYIKRTNRHELVAALAIFFSSEFYLALMFFQEQSILASALQYFVTVMFMTFLLCRRRVALIIAGILGCQALWFLVHVSDSGLVLARDLDFRSYALQVQITNAIVCFFVALMSISHVYFKEKAERGLRREREWLLKNSRLNEVTGMTQNMVTQIARPLGRLRAEMGVLGGSSRDDAQTVERLTAAAEEIIAVTRSFDWLHQSNRFTPVREASLPLLTQQIGILIETKARESGWRLRFEGQMPLLRLRGPLPSLVLLLVTLSHGIFDRFIGDGESQLLLGVKPVDGREILWEFSWPAAGTMRGKDSGDLLEEVRDSLVRELKGECGVEIKEIVRDGRHYLSVLGPFIA